MSPEKTGLINNRATFGKNDDQIYQYTDVGLAIFHSRQWEWTSHASSANDEFTCPKLSNRISNGYVWFAAV
jgi:hypothetical protein